MLRKIFKIFDWVPSGRAQGRGLTKGKVSLTVSPLPPPPPCPRMRSAFKKRINGLNAVQISFSSTKLIYNLLLLKRPFFLAALLMLSPRPRVLQTRLQKNCKLAFACKALTRNTQARLFCKLAVAGKA